MASEPCTFTSSSRAVRRADTGCVVYIDAGAVPTGVRHGREHCPCVKMHGSEDFDHMLRSVRTCLAAEEEELRYLDEKPSVYVAKFLLGMGSDKAVPWDKDVKRGWWTSMFGR